MDYINIETNLFDQEEVYDDCWVLVYPDDTFIWSPNYLQPGVSYPSNNGFMFMPHCTVQILKNSVTGETSVGWYVNGED